MSIKMTPNAVNKVQSMIEDNDLGDGYVVRVAVTATSSKLSYQLDIVDDVHDNDRSFDCGAVSIVVDPRSFLHLKGAVIDFNGGGFSFANPNEP